MIKTVSEKRSLVFVLSFIIASLVVETQSASVCWFVLRNDAPVSAPLVFSRDVFDKFTLAPNVKELFALLHR